MSPLAFGAKLLLKTDATNPFWNAIVPIGAHASATHATIVAHDRASVSVVATSVCGTFAALPLPNHTDSGIPHTNKIPPGTILDD